ncbi:MAG TPA: hypothetical protein VF698_14340 [Thermoanaerobaculia bacterium]|jgi:hypothetical protein
MPTLRDLRSLPPETLQQFLDENLQWLGEQETLAILENRYCSAKMIGAIARNARLTGFYSVRARLVAHRQTPQAHATKLVHYLYWPDLLRLSVDVHVPPAVRRAIDTQLLIRVNKVTLGERITSARRCSHALVKALLFDPEPKVFEALLVNQRLREEDLVDLVRSGEAGVEQLRLIAGDSKWSLRYAIRKALVMNPSTPRAVAAAQLRFLTRRDLLEIHGLPETSTYLRRCIERLPRSGFSLPAEGID